MKLHTVFLVLYVVVLCNAAPQFLPVAVQLDPMTIRRVPRSTTTSTTVLPPTTGKTSRSDTDTTTVSEARKDESNVLESTELAPHKDVAENELQPNTLLLPENKKKDSTTKKNKKRRQKGSKKLIIDQHSFFALKTINDQPAYEVLKTDKASQPRSAEELSESRLVHVRKLKLDG